MNSDRSSCKRTFSRSIIFRMLGGSQLGFFPTAQCQNCVWSCLFPPCDEWWFTGGLRCFHITNDYSWVVQRYYHLETLQMMIQWVVQGVLPLPFANNPFVQKTAFVAVVLRVRVPRTAHALSKGLDAVASSLLSDPIGSCCAQWHDGSRAHPWCPRNDQTWDVCYILPICWLNWLIPISYETSTWRMIFSDQEDKQHWGETVIMKPNILK